MNKTIDGQWDDVQDEASQQEQAEEDTASEVAEGEGKFAWNDQRLQAALLVAEDSRSDKKICEELGIHRATFYRWKKYPAFMTRVHYHVEEFAEAARLHGVARMDLRLARLDNQWDRIQKAQQARAERWAAYLEEYTMDPDDPTLAVPLEVLGGDYTRTLRSVGSGKNFRLIVEYKLDVAQLDQLLKLERQAAMETGQWKEAKKQSNNLPGGAAAMGMGMMGASVGYSGTVAYEVGPKLDELRAFIEWVKKKHAREEELFGVTDQESAAGVQEHPTSATDEEVGITTTRSSSAEAGTTALHAETTPDLVLRPQHEESTATPRSGAPGALLAGRDRVRGKSP